MKILYIAKSSVPSRTANSVHIMKMCQALAKNGNDVWLCVLSENTSEEFTKKDIFRYYAVDDCFQLLNIPLLPDRGRKIRFLFSHLHLIPDLLKMLREMQPDVVYGRDVFSCSIAAFAGQQVVAESHFPLWHGMIASLSFRFLYKRKKFKRLVVISEALRKVYLQHYRKLDPAHVVVAHDGADPVCKQPSCKQLQGFSGALQVGYIGHLYEGKGIEVIAEIASEMPDIDFHVVGGLNKDIGLWEQKINESNVTFHGFISQENLPEYYNSFDVCLLPNQYKVLAYGADPQKKIKNISLFTSPLKMFEYMAYGKAIVASDLPVLREVLNNDVAILVKPDDYSGWIAAIERLRDEKLRRTLGNNARQVFLEKYTWQKRAQSVLVD